MGTWLQTKMLTSQSILSPYNRVKTAFQPAISVIDEARTVSNEEADRGRSKEIPSVILSGKAKGKHEEPLTRVQLPSIH